MSILKIDLDVINREAKNIILEAIDDWIENKSETIDHSINYFILNTYKHYSE